MRQHFQVSGTVQGVGFRPFVYHLARELGLTGWVLNSPAGVELEVQGAQEQVMRFGELLVTSAPPLAVITRCNKEELPLGNDGEFIIRPSSGGMADTQVAPDAALCPDCRRELFDPADRRYRYPFITCTNCGPRYSIITALPYDRPHTTMAGFPLCPACRAEYEDPADRRFHAQPLACAVCGPRLQLVDRDGTHCGEAEAALGRTIELLQQGMIVAIKGVGGYHLAVDAENGAAVQRLRQRKQRDEKPFALMVADLLAGEKIASVGEMEQRLLTSPEAPVVIVRKRETANIAAAVAPGNGWYGIMLPYTPLHHLLFAPAADSSVPAFSALVMTSANSSDEPLVCDDREALQRLAGIADYLLLHNRPIHNRCDDSVLRVFQGAPLLYRRSRGYAPRGIRLPFATQPLLAVGAELKSAICLTQRERATLSPHIGDLQNDRTLSTFRATIDRLGDLLQLQPQLVACDLHPDYLSSVYAGETGLPLVKVQHHHAHLAACMAENNLTGEVVGLVFDGTGYGSDGTLWGGEVLVGGYGSFRRAGHFRPVPLPGGDAAVRQPWRMALSYLYQQLGAEALLIDHPVAAELKPQERSLFTVMLERGLNAPLTSSCGRLFDAVAALLDVRRHVSYDGQAAIELEALAEQYSGQQRSQAYPYALTGIDSPCLQLDFTPLFPSLLADLRQGGEREQIAWQFHVSVAAAAEQAAVITANSSRLDTVVLSGGVFQNRLLSEMLYTRLTKAGLRVFTHRLTPPNDGCIALGQAAVAGFQQL